MPDRREESLVPPRGLEGDAGHRGFDVDSPAGEPSDGRVWSRVSERFGGTSSMAPPVNAPATSPSTRTVRKARLRLIQVEPWSVMKTSFLLSVAVGIVIVVAVAVVWGVLGAAGLWDSVNTIVRDSIGDNTSTPFEIQKYLGTSRVVGFTMVVAVADIILITAISTLGAFLYNLTATLLGGIEVTFAEDR